MNPRQKIGIWQLAGKERSHRMALAMASGVRAMGYNPVIRMDRTYERPTERVAMFYGFQGKLPQIMDDYVSDGRTVVFVDLGYWMRRTGGRYDGYHKVTVNARHPNAYLMDKIRSHDRLARFGVRAERWRDEGQHIILAGMSAKSAESYGYQPEEWERWAVQELRKHTSRRIVYRPKPSWTGARPIDGAVMGPAQSLRDAFRSAYAVVTHHSNVAIDAIAAGIPAWCWDGAAALMSSQDLSQIDNPVRPKGREQWLANLAYCQWSTQEMQNGELVQFLQAEGVL